MRQAIQTIYYGPNNTKGSRVSARADGGRVTVGWDHALHIPENHARAAQALAKKMGWCGVWVGGGAAAGYVFVWIGERESVGSIGWGKLGKDYFVA